MPEGSRAAHIPEVLAPAGGWDSLVAAVRSGADAVYLGGTSLNARRGAQGFEDASLREAALYCHARGVKLYLALNTLVFDNEEREAARLLELACSVGMDAVIVQDLAVAALVRRHAPELPLHASTQMSVHDANGARLLEELGFSRVVVARELSGKELSALRAATRLELECFVHGALCMCVSGQCYFSALLGGRSGNRGLCAQPCRLPFRAGSQEYALSLRDLSLIHKACALAELGITALKIEGRMKRPEYVAGAVDACRRALAGQEPDYAALEAVFSRSGFTSGYYDGRLGREMFGIRRKEDVHSAAPVLKGLAALYKEERQSVAVSMELRLTQGSGALLCVGDDDANRVTVTGPLPQQAQTAPTTQEKAAAALRKVGGTFYTVGNLSSKIDDGLMIPAAELNALRRRALEQLTALRSVPHPIAFVPLPQRDEKAYVSAHPPVLRVRIARVAHLEAVLDAHEIVVPAELFAQCDQATLRACREKLFVEIPGIVFNKQEKLDEILQNVKRLGVERATVGGLGGIERARAHGFSAHGAQGLNITSTQALAQYQKLGLRDATLSFELSLRQIRSLGGDLPRGLLAFGHLPLMVMRNCPIGSCKRCEKNFPELTDRLGNHFFVDCAWQAVYLYNHIPLFFGDRLEDMSQVDFLTLYFTRESPAECGRVLSLYRTGGQWTGPMTRGLYDRGVL